VVAVEDGLEGRGVVESHGSASPQPPADRNVYGVLVASAQADVFITYCTNAVVAIAEQPQLRSTPIPPAINVGADYGLTVRNGAPAQAQAFAAFLLSADASFGSQSFFCSSVPPQRISSAAISERVPRDPTPM